LLSSLDDRLRSVGRETLDLGWPVAVQQTLNTLMRTVDILVTGFFSPVAVAAISLADLYSRLPLRIGMGLGSGAIALSSQETGWGSADTRDRAVTQAILIGVRSGIPLIGVLLFVAAEPLATLFTRDAATVGFATDFNRAFAVAMVFIGIYFPLSGSLKGAGDTRTPFYAGIVESYVFLLGASYLFAVVLDLGLTGVYVGIVLSYVSRAAIVGVEIIGDDWTELAARMIDERESSRGDSG